MVDAPQRKHRRKWWLAAAALWIAASLLLPASWVEQLYSGGLYPWINAVLVPLSGSVDVPWTGCAIVLAMAILAIGSVRAWRGQRAAGCSRGARLFAQGKAVLYVALVLYSWFLLTWGMGYRRVPVEERLQLGDAPLSAAEIERFTNAIVRVIERDAPELGRDDHAAALEAIRAAMVRTVEQLGWLGAAAARSREAPARGGAALLRVVGRRVPVAARGKRRRWLPRSFGLSPAPATSWVTWPVTAVRRTQTWSDSRLACPRLIRTRATRSRWMPSNASQAS